MSHRVAIRTIPPEQNQELWIEDNETFPQLVVLIPQIVINGGATGWGIETDWINPTLGLAEGWGNINNNCWNA